MSHFGRREWVAKSEEVGVAGKLVDHNKNAIELARIRKAINEVHGDYLPRAIWNWERFEQAGVANALWLGLLAYGARLHIFLDGGGACRSLTLRNGRPLSCHGRRRACVVVETESLRARLCL